MKEQLLKIYESFDEAQATGIDGITKALFDKNIAQELETIVRKISNYTYEFSYYKQKILVKSINKTREISIPTLRDKLVIKYLYKKIYDTFDEDMQQMPSLHTMIKSIKDEKRNYDSFLKIDIQNFFPSINHDILFDKLKIKIDDHLILSLIHKAITQTTIDINTPSTDRIKYNNPTGLPQGLSISGTLADIYLLDLETKYKSLVDVKFYRYVDDILILCNQDNIKRLSFKLQEDFFALKLTIHDFEANSSKSSYGNLKDTPFDFLGYTFCGDTISVRDRSLQKMFINISKIFTQYKHHQFQSKNQLYKKLNLKITGCIIDGKQYGWIYFFSFINDHKLLLTLDRFVQKNCKKLNLDYDKIKKFSRAIYEVKNPNSNYIEDLKKFDYKTRKTLILEYKDDIEFY